MPVRNLKKIFRPRHIAVIGASDQPSKVGYMVLRNLLAGGFRGNIYPVNIQRTEVQGIPAHASVKDLPSPVDLAVICTPAATVPQLVQECGEAGIQGVVVISAGFGEMGAAGEPLQQELQAALARFPEMRLLGPNCLGFMVPRIGLNASFAGGLPAPGHLALISQSGALCTSLLDWAIDEEIGFSAFVSIGNMLDVGVGSLIDYFANDPYTKALILYVESVPSAREFMSAARAFCRVKPIVAYKAGRFAESAQAAASHTGAMAGVDSVYDAAFARAGIVRVFDVGEIFDCAELLARHHLPAGNRLTIVTNAGGPGIMATDTLIAERGKLAELAPETIEQLNEKLPPHWSRGNPVDVLGDAPPLRFSDALDAVLADPGTDAALTILTPQAMTDATGTAAAVARVAAERSKPLLASWMGSQSVREGERVLSRSGIPTYDTPERAVRAFLHLAEYGRRRTLLSETPRDLPIAFDLDRTRCREELLQRLPEERAMLPELESKALLEAYGISAARPQVARSAEEAVARAQQIGYPVVLKILSPQITHKTEVEGVALNLQNDQEVERAYRTMLDTAAERRPDAEIEGVTVQPMIAMADSTELIVGARQDPVFGAVMMVGAGGVTAELLQDTALELPPLNERLARRVLESLRIWPLLAGYRGRPAADLEQLIEVLIRFSYLVADYPEIQEIDVNPLLVSSQAVVALDARMLVDADAAPPAPYGHLAIRPYPDEFVQRGQVKDGTPILLRPIKPEDVPLWHEFLESCSQRSIWFHFQCLFREATHEMDARYCFIDYDREMTIVAEVQNGRRRSIVGVGRLVADPDRHQAEYAVLVTDAWQGKGLGSLLTGYCTEIARQWGVKELIAETTPDNFRMLAIFHKWGFDVQPQLQEKTVLVRKQVEAVPQRTHA